MCSFRCYEKSKLNNDWTFIVELLDAEVGNTHVHNIDTCYVSYGCRAALRAKRDTLTKHVASTTRDTWALP